MDGRIMSLIKSIKSQLGLSTTPANNFTLDASADNGSLTLNRNSGQDIMTVDAAGKVAFPQMPQTLGTNGSYELPGGLIIKWGTLTTGSSATSPVAFASAFTTACYVVSTNTQNTGPYVSNTNSLSVSGFNCDAWVMSGATRAAVIVNWIAIGK